MLIWQFLESEVFWGGICHYKMTKLYCCFKTWAISWQTEFRNSQLWTKKSNERIIVTVESNWIQSQFPDLVKEDSFVYTLNLFAMDRAIFWCGGGKKDGKRRQVLLPYIWTDFVIQSLQLAIS